MNAKTTTSKENKASKENSNVVANINGHNVTMDTKIQYVEANPKRKGSKAYTRFEKYMVAKTVKEFLNLDGLRADLRYDADKKFVEILK